MQSDKFDKRTREAAENHHPAYDEQAWEKMSKLLDKHLPEKEEKKRRFIFFIFLFLLLGGSTWLLTTRPWEREEKTVGIQNDIPRNPAQDQSDVIQQTIPGRQDSETVKLQQQQSPSPGTGESKNGAGTIIEPPGSTPGQSEQANQSKEDYILNDKAAINIASEKSTSSQTTDTRPLLVRNTKTGERVPNPQDKKSLPVKKDSPKNEPANLNAAISPNEKSETSVADKNANENTLPKNRQETAQPLKPDLVKNNEPNTDGKATQEQTDAKDVVKSELPPKENPAKDSVANGAKKSPRKSRKNSLVFTISAGPDVSVVGSNQLGKTRMVTGLGLSYTIREKFTISSGFYSARKIYSAGPSDYKAPPEFYQAYPFLEKVDANCRVYEIPVSLAYNFGKRKSQHWFVSAGLSTFLMNEEGYTYFYKYTPTGNTFTNNWKVKNENSHFFSVGTFSAGYRKQVGKRISLSAEPYLKIPFAGVGYGKVKLNSGGVLFSMGIKLF